MAYLKSLVGQFIALKIVKEKEDMIIFGSPSKAEKPLRVLNLVPSAIFHEYTLQIQTSVASLLMVCIILFSYICVYIYVCIHTHPTRPCSSFKQDGLEQMNNGR